MAVDRLKWGVLGTGLAARVAMLPALASLPQTEVVAVAGSDRARAEALAAAHRVPRAYGTYQALLNDPDVECVYLALPNHLHMEWVLRAAHAGKHILCEKPLGGDPREVEAMRDGCEVAGVRLMESLMFRFHPRTIRLRELLANGVAGEIRAAHAAFTFTLAPGANYRWRPEQGGGALLDVGSYCVDAARLAFGAEPEWASATGRHGETGALVNFAGMLGFGNGRAAHLTGSFEGAEWQRLHIIGSDAVIELPLAFTAWRDDAVPILMHRGSETEAITFPPTDPYALTALAFTEAVLRDTAPPYTLDESLGTARAIAALALAARTGARHRVQ
jgi:predicted dehydrogenase